jgi:hypothetical protein
MEQHLPRMLFAPVALVPGPQAHLSYGLGKIMKVKVGKLFFLLTSSPRPISVKNIG